jgi:hypothetical protein
MRSTEEMQKQVPNWAGGVKGVFFPRNPQRRSLEANAAGGAGDPGAQHVQRPGGRRGARRPSRTRLAGASPGPPGGRRGRQAGRPGASNGPPAAFRGAVPAGRANVRSPRPPAAGAPAPTPGADRYASGGGRPGAPAPPQRPPPRAPPTAAPGPRAASAPAPVPARDRPAQPRAPRPPGFGGRTPGFAIGIPPSPGPRPPPVDYVEPGNPQKGRGAGGQCVL